tara:strand:- start:936 stop:1349 length:414 start_codon:yes stop_codon:yes gene_type:complete
MFNLLIPAISTVIDKIFPDAGEAAKAKAEMHALQMQGEFKQLEAELQISLGQIAINQEEAKSHSLYKSGWRPAVGWVCVFGLAYSFLLQPLLAWVSSIFTTPVPPVLDLGALITLLGGMLGLSINRTFEKVKKVHRK